MLYLRLLEQKKEESGAILFTAGDTCAVFDEKELEMLINQASARVFNLRKIRRAAEEHKIAVAPWMLDQLKIPYKVKAFVSKKC